MDRKKGPEEEKIRYQKIGGSREQIAFLFIEPGSTFLEVDPVQIYTILIIVPEVLLIFSTETSIKY